MGLFGGTFNPVHCAHLRAAEEAREMCALDRVEFVLAAIPPHKPGAGIASVAHRRRMLELAIAGNPAFAVNTSEVERTGASYSIDTIREAQSHAPETRFTFLVGGDAFAEIESWKRFDEIFAQCDVCVLSRPGSTVARPPIAIEHAFRYDSDRRVYVHVSGNALRFVSITPLMISASDIRQRCAEGRSIRYLVPGEVETYVREHGVYAGGTTAS
ncbi:MAG TPA: nicotinate-nucleotide adenylyltransferase [Candidatus Binatia bacterium]